MLGLSFIKYNDNNTFEFYSDLTTMSNDLFASNTNPDAVWHKEFPLPTQFAARGTEYCCAVVNMATMVASQSDRIFLFDFATNHSL